MSPTGKQVAVVIGATSKWQADNRRAKQVVSRYDRELPTAAGQGLGLFHQPMQS